MNWVAEVGRVETKGLFVDVAGRVRVVSGLCGNVDDGSRISGQGVSEMVGRC